jgi:putative ABC transport system substrate-binding protein
MPDLRGREVMLALAGAAAWPLAARAQHAADVPRLIGFLHAGPEAAQRRNFGAFQAGMGQLGYVDGQNIRYEYRFGEDMERLPALAAELVARRPNVIVSAPLPANVAAKQATDTIPIVMATGADPARFGVVASLFSRAAT